MPAFRGRRAHAYGLHALVGAVYDAPRPNDTRQEAGVGRRRGRREGDDGTLAGYAVAWFVVGEGEVANIAVHPGCRGQGVGASLIDDVLREARQRQTTAVFLEVRESNDPARQLYASRGFQQVGRRRKYYRHPVEDALLLRWVPDDPAA